MVKSASNPQAMVSQIIQNNPNYQKIQQQANEIAKQFGGNYEEAFKSTAKQMGINPDEFINYFK